MFVLLFASARCLCSSSTRRGQLVPADCQQASKQHDLLAGAAAECISRDQLVALVA